eukprot:6430312-Amphidinium_carterae.1
MHYLVGTVWDGVFKSPRLPTTSRYSQLRKLARNYQKYSQLPLNISSHHHMRCLWCVSCDFAPSAQLQLFLLPSLFPAIVAQVAELALCATMAAFVDEGT